MSFIRPGASKFLTRWRELALTLCAAAFGLWVATRGGLFYGTLGSLICVFALGLALAAWRSMRFGAGAGVEAPGIVQYDEGAVAYFGPQTGGVVALSEIDEVSIAATPDGPVWRIAQQGAPRVDIPLGARGSERLLDTFAALPGARPATFLDAAEHPPAGEARLWKRAGTPQESHLPKP